MKTNIRKSVFETNSSSEHSVSIRRINVSDDIKEYLDTHGPCIEVNTGEFGWEFKTYTQPESKLSYVYTLACSGAYEVYLERKEFIDKALRSVLFDPVFEEIRCEKSVCDPEHTYCEGDNFFYVDHAFSWSSNFIEDIFSDKDLFLQLVFGKDSFILTGNDNVDCDVIGDGSPVNYYPESVEYFKSN